MKLFSEKINKNLSKFLKLHYKNALSELQRILHKFQS